jgi:hypothetical protein
MDREHSALMALFVCSDAQNSRQAREKAVMIKVLERLFNKTVGEHAPNTHKPTVNLKRSNINDDFRAVEIEPSIMCCAAATQARGKPYLLRGAPRLPLYGCTMATTCSCKFRKKADRRDSDRRLFGATETNRWFVGLDSRKRRSRRSMEE